MISHQSTQRRMRHGEISAHKLGQMMIKVGCSRQEQPYHANSPKAQSLHSLHRSLSLEVKRRSLLQSEDWVPGFLQRIHPAPDWESFQNVGPSRCHLIFLCLKRNSHNLQCVPWGHRCQAMIGGFQNSTPVARKEGRVTQRSPWAVQEISRIEPYWLKHPSIAFHRIRNLWESTTHG